MDLACKFCAVPIFKKSGKGRSPTCCTACRERYGSKRTAKWICAVCGVSFIGVDKATTQFCSTKCAGAARVRPRPHCLACGKRTGNLKTTFCSVQCGNTYRWRDLQRKPRKSGTSDRRRCREFGIKYSELDRWEIFERDNWTCGICKTAVDQSLKYPHPLSISLDHIVPLSVGGVHSAENAQCAHLRCNLQKSNGRTAAA